MRYFGSWYLNDLSLVGMCLVLVDCLKGGGVSDVGGGGVRCDPVGD